MVMYLQLTRHANMSVPCRSPHTPILYSKIGVYKGIPLYVSMSMFLYVLNPRGTSDSYSGIPSAEGG